MTILFDRQLIDRNTFLSSDYSENDDDDDILKYAPGEKVKNQHGGKTYRRKKTRNHTRRRRNHKK